MVINQNYWTLLDEAGNLIYPEGNILYLKRKGKKGKREIGRLQFLNESWFYISSRKSKDVFQKLNAWGINWQVFNHLPEGCFIIINTEDKAYRIKKELAADKGKFFYFKLQGFEKQIFIPLEFFEKFDNNSEIVVDV